MQALRRGAVKLRPGLEGVSIDPGIGGEPRKAALRPSGNILLRKMIPDAFPLPPRAESFDIYIGSTAVGNFRF